MSVRWTTRRLLLLLVLAALAAAYAWAGVIMNADFSMSAATEAQAVGYRQAVYVFAAMALLCITVALSAFVGLWRARRPSRPAI